MATPRQASWIETGVNQHQAYWVAIGVKVLVVIKAIPVVKKKKIVMRSKG
jgi:hypothetical protein